MTLLKIFVYGTLKPGELNYQRYCGAKVVDACPAIARGQLFHLQLRGYPAMIEGEGKVQGFLLTFKDSAILDELDQLEDYQPHRLPEQNEYQRQLINVFNPNQQPLGLAWAYFMLPHVVKSLGGVPLPNGCWGKGTT